MTLDAGIDGGLLWLMVDDFNEFSVIVTNPVERLHLKRYVKNYVDHQVSSDQNQVQDDMVIFVIRYHTICISLVYTLCKILFQDVEICSLDDSDQESPRINTRVCCCCIMQA